MKSLARPLRGLASRFSGKFQAAELNMKFQHNITSNTRSSESSKSNFCSRGQARMLKPDIAGFGAITAIFIIVALSVLAVGGFYIYRTIPIPPISTQPKLSPLLPLPAEIRQQESNPSTAKSRGDVAQETRPPMPQAVPQTVKNALPSSPPSANGISPTNEVDFKKLAQKLPPQFFPRFTGDKDAALFVIALGALPEHLVRWNEQTFKEYAKRLSFLGWIQNPESQDYTIVLPKPDPPNSDSATIADLCTAATIIHEYAHFIDKEVFDSPAAISNTKDFYSISHDSAPRDPVGTYYFVRRPNNLTNEFVSNYAIYGFVPPNERFTSVPWEDFAESFTMYVTHGKIFKELTKSDLYMKQKYDWLKINVFYGREYDTGDLRRLAEVRKQMFPADNSIKTSCDHSWALYPELRWNYKF